MVQSDEERKERNRIRMQEYNNRPEVVAKRIEYNARPERKAKMKEYNARPENVAKRKEWESSPEYLKWREEYETRPETIAIRKDYEKSPERKARRKERNQSSEYKARDKEYNARPENKARAQENRSKPEIKVNRKKYGEKRRIKLKKEVCLHYSKIHSNSEIPCCRCCGLNTHIDFLSLDHIAGRKEMDSEPELVKLGYSSKLKTEPLQVWLKNNNFPKGFQILCYNCNFAKGHSKDNTCPHEKIHLEETFDRMTAQSSFEL